MDGTIIGQGSFVSNSTNLANPTPGTASISNANPVIIAIPSGADWVKVRNYSMYSTSTPVAGAVFFNGTSGALPGVEFYWQRGMAAGTGIAFYKSGANSLNGDTFLSGGFTLYDPSGQSAGSLPLLGPAVATTASTNVVRPVVSTASTAGLSVGSVVRLSGTAQTDVNGIDFVVGAVVANTSFTLLTASNPLATAPGVVGGAGFYRIVNVDPLFYPRRRFIVNITQAVNAQVSTSVAHGLTVGQEVRFSIPAVSGMIQLNSSVANNFLAPIIVSVIDDFNFTINVDTTAFTAFSYPTVAQQPSNFPVVNPVGEDTATSISSVAAQTPSVGGVQIFNTNTGLLADSTVNTGQLGMVLGSGGADAVGTGNIIGPAGTIAWSAANVATGSTVYWVAGKSTYGGL